MNATTSKTPFNTQPYGRDFWRAAMPAMPAQCDEPYGAGCSKGYELAADYLATLRREPGLCGGNTLGDVLSAMPWDTYNSEEDATPQQDYQKGVMVGFLSMLEHFIGPSVRIVDPHKYVREYEQWHAARRAEVEAEERASRRAAARRGWKTRRAAAA